MGFPALENLKYLAQLHVSIPNRDLWVFRHLSAIFHYFCSTSFNP